MKKINVRLEKQNIIFEIDNDVNDTNLNYTNVINTKKIKFSEEYILKNIKSTSSFFNTILNEKKYTAIIKDMEIAETILKLLKNISLIKEISFPKNEKLSYTLSNLLLENHNLECIDCYTMPEYIFKKFNKTKINLRYDYLFVSKFMSLNELDTYSKIYYKKNIKIINKLGKYDIEDLNEFFKINNYLKRIDIIDYNEEDLEIILKLIKEYMINNIDIFIYQNDNNTDLLLKSINKFKKIEKKYNINIKIKYSNRYKKNNIIKQTNLNMFKLILILIILFCTLIIITYNFVQKKDNKKITDINDKIQNIVDQSSNQEIEENVPEESLIPKGTAYFTNYSQVFSELLKINKDTVGWIKINNTKVNYPVVQSSDNDYYLRHDYNLESNLAGWIYVDYRNNIENLNKNTIIYGHNVEQAELMFGSLDRTLNETWYKDKSNRNIIFNTIYENHTFQIFSIYTIEETNDYLLTDFSSSQSFINYVQKAKDRSIYNFNVDVNDKDNIITLSTCYGNSSDQRIVIHAKEIK